MLFSFGKTLFAALTLGVAVASAAPAPENANAVAKRGDETNLLTLLANVTVEVGSYCDQLGRPISMILSYATPLTRFRFALHSRPCCQRETGRRDH